MGILFLVCLTTITFAQKEANTWYFGEEAGLDFNSGTPMVLTDGAMKTSEGCAAISSKQTGKLKFYTDGESVWNREHNLMPNGEGLLGFKSSVQSSIIVPEGCDSNIYYIFTTDGATVDPSTGRKNFPNDSVFCYSIVDMSLDSGRGDLLIKNKVLFSPVNESVGAVKHANRRDTWVVAHKHLSDQFYAYLVTPNGVEGPIISSPGGKTQSNFSVSHLKFSPQGNKLAYGHQEMEIFDFDNKTGMVAPNPINLGPNSSAYGINISSNGNVLYASELSARLVQYDLTAGDAAQILASKVVIYDPIQTKNTNDFWGRSIQSATDGKMYITKTKPYADSLGIIHNPNVLGTGCNYDNNGLWLDGKKSSYGLPNFIESFFDPNWVPYTNITSLNIGIENPFYEDDPPVNLKSNSSEGIWSGTGITDAINGTFDPSVASVGEHTLIYTDPNSCSGVDSITVVVKPRNLRIYIPNSFSPNKDDVNETFFPIGLENVIDNYLFTVFNRWGQIVFSSTDPEGRWDGYHKGKLVQQGVYMWQYSYTDNDGQLKKKHGKVTVVL